MIANDVDVTLDLRDKSNESNHNLCVFDCAKKNALNILEENKQAIETFKKSENDQNYFVWYHNSYELDDFASKLYFIDIYFVSIMFSTILR